MKKKTSSTQVFVFKNQKDNSIIKVRSTSLESAIEKFERKTKTFAIEIITMFDKFSRKYQDIVEIKSETYNNHLIALIKD